MNINKESSEPTFYNGAIFTILRILSILSLLFQEHFSHPAAVGPHFGAVEGLAVMNARVPGIHTQLQISLYTLNLL